MILSAPQRKALRKASSTLLRPDGTSYRSGKRVIHHQTLRSLVEHHLVYEHVSGHLELTRKGEVELGRRS